MKGSTNTLVNALVYMVYGALFLTIRGAVSAAFRACTVVCGGINVVGKTTTDDSRVAGLPSVDGDWRRADGRQSADYEYGHLTS